jgi:hypothetical protein
MYLSKKSEKPLVMFIFILCGIVIGGAIGDYASEAQMFYWLGYGKTFGFLEPIIMDINAIVLTFGLKIYINIASIIGIIIGISLYKKVYLK